MNEAIRLRVACDRRSFCDLETDTASAQAARAELIDDKRQKLLVREALT